MKTTTTIGKKKTGTGCVLAWLRSSLGLFVCVIGSSSQAQTAGSEIEVGPAPVVEATVYLSGAEIVRAVDARVPRGASIVTILRFPDAIDPAEVRVSSTISSAQVGSLVVREREVGGDGDVAALDRQIAAIEDRVFELDQIDKDQTAMRSFLDAAVETKTRPGTENDPADELDPESIMAIYGLMQARQDELRAGQVERRLERRNLQAQMDEAKEARRDATRTESFRVAHIQVQADQAGVIPIQLRYFVPEAQWAPRYRASLDDNGTVELIAEAAVRQWTGDDWSEAHLRLTTVTPRKQLGPPALDAWTLAPKAPPATTSKMSAIDLKAVGAARDPWAIVTQTPGVLSDRINVGGAETGQQAVFISPGSATAGGSGGESAARGRSAPSTTRRAPRRLESVRTRYSLTFDAVGRPNVPGDGQTRRVELWHERLPATVSYRVKPSLVADAFLEAAVRVPDETPLLPGSIRIFAGDSRLGEARLPETPAGANLIIPFGVDKRVQIDRSVLEASSERKGSKHQLISHAYRTTVTNLTEAPIQVVLEDRQPTSEDERIVISRVAEKTTAGAGASKHRPGVWLWKLDVQPNEPKIIDFAFTVRHPVDVEVQVGG